MKINILLNDFKSLNPYFNGYTTLTYKKREKNESQYECLNPYFNGYTTLTRRRTRDIVL